MAHTKLPLTTWFLAMYRAVLFIMGIKGLTHPRTAVRGNLLGGLGMLLAVVVTLVDKEMIGWGWIIVGLVIGTPPGQPPGAQSVIGSFSIEICFGLSLGKLMMEPIVGAVGLRFQPV